MLDKMEYVNSKNETVILGEGDILLGSNDVRNYALNYSTVYEVITDFTRGQTTKRLPITIYGQNAYSRANDIYDIFMYDVVSNKPGRLYIGNYYLQGYFYASEKTVINKPGVYKTTLSFICEKSTWVKETVITGQGSAPSFEGLDFPFDFSFDYFSPGVLTITNESLAAADFLMTIYGNDNQRVNFMIGPNVYIINGALATNEKITIDTKNKTLIKTDAVGEESNIFSQRAKSSYIFEKIPSGLNTAYFDGFEWKATIYQERSEPKWI